MAPGLSRKDKVKVKTATFQTGGPEHARRPEARSSALRSTHGDRRRRAPESRSWDSVLQATGSHGRADPHCPELGQAGVGKQEEGGGC